MLEKNSLYNAYKVAFKVTPIGTLLLLISMVTLGTIPGLQAWFFTDLINSLIDKQSGANIVYLYIILSCITLLQIILYISNDISINTVKNKLEQASTTEIIKIAFSIPQIIIEQEDFQKKLSRAKANIDSYFLLIQGFQNLCTTVVAIISFVIYVSTINQYLCIVFVICIFAYSLQMYFQSKKEHKLQLDQASEQRELDYLSKVLTNLEYAKEVRLFNFPKYIIDRWTKSFNKINNEHLVMKKNHLLSNMFVTNTGFLFIGFFFITAAYSVLSGKGTSGIFAGLVSFLSQLGPMLSNVGNNIKSLNINRMNVHELISYIYLEKTFEKESSNPINMSRGYIRIENVDFRYPNSLQNTLNDINLIIEPGEIVAIVGENGAGKTTLSRLIAGLYQPTNGQISINGVYYNDINNEEISCMAGIVPQEPHNFELSFIDNLCFGQDIIEEQVIATLNKVKLNDLLERLPNRLQTHLGKLFGNDDLSKGEWQKLALARCFIKERLFYVLDEPTSALDPDAEVEILDLLRTLSSDKTTIFISHRLGSLRNVDRIIVLKEGRVVEMGRHQDLIVQNGEYTRLYNTQAFWYMEGA